MIGSRGAKTFNERMNVLKTLGFSPNVHNVQGWAPERRLKNAIKSMTFGRSTRSPLRGRGLLNVAAPRGCAAYWRCSWKT